MIRIRNAALRIAQLTAEGNSAKEIAVELGISPRTVERHLDETRERLGARNKAHLMSLLFRQGDLR